MTHLKKYYKIELSFLKKGPALRDKKIFKLVVRKDDLNERTSK